MAVTRPYTPQSWETGDVITKEKLNNIEQGLAAIDTEVTGARGSGSASGTLGKRIDDLIMVQDTQPTSTDNEIWIRSTGEGVQVPTYEEFNGLKSNFNTAIDGINEQGTEITGGIIAFDKAGKDITQISISDSSVSSATITRCGKNICPKFSSGSGNGLSWEVASDGTITFTGTPSADTMLRMYDQNIPIKNGEKKTFAFFNNRADENNRLSFFMVSSGGNPQINLNTINKVSVLTQSITNTVICTEIRLRIPANFDATGMIIKPMIAVGDVDIQQFEEYNGQTYNVTVNSGVVQDSSITYLDGTNTMWSSVGDIAVTYDKVGNIKEYVDDQFAAISLFPSFYKYVQRTYSAGTQRYLYVYYKSGDKVIQWILMNTPSSQTSTGNSNTWQIGGVKGYDFDGITLSNEVNLALNGEFELAIKEHGAEDYCGGINHGDENTDSFMLFIDGKNISDLTTLDENYHAFSRIDAFEIATVNRCNTPSVDIIKHQKIWTFENGKVRVHQTCKFLEQIQVDVMMICMFKAVREVYSYGIRQGDTEIETMTDASFTKKYTTGNDAYYMYYGTNATATIHAKTDNDGSIRQSTLWINNASDSNKLYFGYWGENVSASPVTVPAGTVITEETEYNVVYN